MVPLRSTRSFVVAVAIAAGFTVSGGAATALAQTQDEQFTNAVTSMGIPLGASDDAPTVGKRICEMLTTGLTGQANPVPVVRGVVNTLSGNGLSRDQAIGLTRLAVGVYCPQYGRYFGR